MAQADRRPLEKEDTRIDVGHYLRIVWRRRLFVFLPVLFITSITAVGVRFLTPVYVSRAKVHLEARTRVNNELERQIVDEDRRVRQKDQLTQVHNQLNSREFLEDVVRELGMQNDATVLAQARLLHDTRTPDVAADEIAIRILVRGLRNKLDVKNSDPNTFVVAIQDNDPESAYLLAKVVTRNFVEEAKRERLAKLEELFKFSTQQSRVYRDKLEEAEKNLRDFQAGLIREQNAGNTVNVANVSLARNHLNRMQLDIEQAEHRIENLRSLLRQVLDPLPDVRVLRADKEVAALEHGLHGVLDGSVVSELERLRASAETQPAGPGASDPGGGTRAALRRRLSDVVDERYASADAFYRDRIAEYAYEISALDVERASAGKLADLIARYGKQAEQQPEKELQLQGLQDRVATARVNLETFERTLQSTEVSETMMATQLAGGVDIVDPPEKPVAPLKPDRGRLVAIAFLLALFGGLGTVFGLEYLDKSFKDIEEIERVLDLHVVGTVPRVSHGLPFGSIPGNRKQGWMVVSSLVILLVVLGGMGLYEHLLRKQHVALSRDRVEEILRSEQGGAPGAAARPASAPHK